MRMGGGALVECTICYKKLGVGMGPEWVGGGSGEEIPLALELCLLHDNDSFWLLGKLYIRAAPPPQ